MKMTKMIALALVAVLLVFAVSCDDSATSKKHVHAKGTHHEALGTCRTAGAPEYWECEGCAEWLDEDGSVLASKEDVKNPTNHDSSTFTYDQDRYTHYPICGCGASLEELEEPHNLAGFPMVCIVCGYVD
ncbi:MAG: hypothetical protein KBS81_06260 [Spirochaetales bacterium]|nr:hypothetical protein [Candidatus Physcosoma equi]